MIGEKERKKKLTTRDRFTPRPVRGGGEKRGGEGERKSVNKDLILEGIDDRKGKMDWVTGIRRGKDNMTKIRCTKIR